MPYFSKRGKKLTYEVTAEFWNAFKAYIVDLGGQGYFPTFMKKTEGEWVIEANKVNLQAQQELGIEIYPFTILTDPLSDIKVRPVKDCIFDIIEFFYNYISIPEYSLDDQYAVPVTKYDTEAGKKAYTSRVNELFENYRLSYKIENGEVKDRHSEVIDKVITNTDFNIPDPQTETMLNMAIDKFYSRDFKEQKIALNKLIDAYQRISSWEDDDKKNSIGKILDKISEGDEEIKDILGEDCQELWKTVHIFLTRHAEKDKIPINDKDVLEYLFYAYFNVIRFILKKYGYIKEYSDKREAEKEFEGVPPEEDEELPF